MTDPGTTAPSETPLPPPSEQLPDLSDQAPTGTLVLMTFFLAAMAALWILVYRLLLER